MYSTRHNYTAQGGAQLVHNPCGQRVAVTVLRASGHKLTRRELDATEPLIGLLRFDRSNGDGMAFRMNGLFDLIDEKSSPNSQYSIARLFSPILTDWNADGIICEGWVLEHLPGDSKPRQLVQLWWIRQLDALSAKQGI